MFLWSPEAKNLPEYYYSTGVSVRVRFHTKQSIHGGLLCEKAAEGCREAPRVASVLDGSFYKNYQISI